MLLLLADSYHLISDVTLLEVTFFLRLIDISSYQI